MCLTVRTPNRYALTINKKHGINLTVSCVGGGSARMCYAELSSPHVFIVKIVLFINNSYRTKLLPRKLEDEREQHRKVNAFSVSLYLAHCTQRNRRARVCV